MIYAECCERGAQNCAKFKDKWALYYTVTAHEILGSNSEEVQIPLVEDPISFCPFCGKKLGESTVSEGVSYAENDGPLNQRGFLKAMEPKEEK